MTIKMPRGAIPTPRSELAASEPYRPEAGAEIFVPSGEFPTPNHELAAAQPYRAGGAAPESFIAWPIGIGFWGNEKVSNSSWAEEAFAKACAEPKVLAPDSVKYMSHHAPPTIADGKLILATSMLQPPPPAPIEAGGVIVYELASPASTASPANQACNLLGAPAAHLLRHGAHLPECAGRRACCLSVP
jgi:hypothetical protein